MNRIPLPPPGYEYSLAKKQNIICAFHPRQPILYLDEKTMTWQVLDRHVSEVHPAQDRSTC